MSAGNLCSGNFGNDLGTSVGLADLADNTNGGHLRWWYLGVPPHPIALGPAGHVRASIRGVAVSTAPFNPAMRPPDVRIGGPQ